MHTNEQLITDFYDAFSKRDGKTMAGFYHEDAQFSDPAFPDLDSAGVQKMWQMLCENGKDLNVVSSGIEANDSTGKAHWVATYTFSKTGRKVINVIDATFTFKDGKILSHNDNFSFWKWSRQALGPVGLFLGWTPFLKNTVQKTAAKSLKVFKVA